MSKETAAYQLCDLHDPLLKEMVENEEELRDTCNVSVLARSSNSHSIFKCVIQERDGWYTTHAFERIKAVLRLKFFSLLSGHIVTDQEVDNLLQGQANVEKPKPTHRVRPSKHNMAKGALREEDAAVRHRLSRHYTHSRDLIIWLWCYRR